jgi:hypothetical protein
MTQDEKKKDKTFARSDQPQLRAGESDPRDDHRGGLMQPEPFYIAHCRASLEAETDWTIRMYCVLNDFDDDTEAELREALPELSKRDEGSYGTA